MKNVFAFAVLLIFSAGCCGLTPESVLTEEVEKNIEYSYELDEYTNNLVICSFGIDEKKIAYFHVLSKDKSDLTYILYDINKVQMDLTASPGYIQLEEGETAGEDSPEYYRALTLDPGNYEILVTKPNAGSISVIVESSEKMTCG